MRRLALLIFSTMFVFGGWGQFSDVGNRGERAREAGLPVSDDFVRACGLAMILAALGLQIRPLRRLSAFVLAAMMPPISYSGHAFWKMEPGPERRANAINFYKNVSLLGGALYVAATADD